MTEAQLLSQMGTKVAAKDLLEQSLMTKNGIISKDMADSIYRQGRSIYEGIKNGEIDINELTKGGVYKNLNNINYYGDYSMVDINSLKEKYESLGLKIDDSFKQNGVKVEGKFADFSIIDNQPTVQLYAGANDSSLLHELIHYRQFLKSGEEIGNFNAWVKNNQWTLEYQDRLMLYRLIKKIIRSFLWLIKITT